MPPLDSACAPEIGARPTGRRTPIDLPILRDRRWKGRSTGESPADPRRPTGRDWLHRREGESRAARGARLDPGRRRAAGFVTARQASDRRRLASAGRIDTIRRATGAIREVCGAWDSARRRRSRWSSDRSALSWTRFSLNSTSPWADEGRFHDFDLAQAIQNPGVGADLTRGSSDAGGRQGRFSALAGRLVAECGRPAPWNGVVSAFARALQGPGDAILGVAEKWSRDAPAQGRVRNLPGGP
jgi:hypothetical protein